MADGDTIHESEVRKMPIEKIAPYKMTEKVFNDTCDDLEAEGHYCHVRRADFATYFKRVNSVRTAQLKPYMAMIVVDRHRSRKTVTIISGHMLDVMNNLMAGNAPDQGEIISNNQKSVEMCAKCGKNQKHLSAALCEPCML